MNALLEAAESGATQKAAVHAAFSELAEGGLDVILGQPLDVVLSKLES